MSCEMSKSFTFDELKANLQILSSPELKEAFSNLKFAEVKEYFIAGVKKYVDIKGTASRKEFWQFYLAYLVLCLIPIVNLLCWWIFLLPFLCISVRRLHDVGKSGVLMLWALIPFVGGLIPLILCMGKSVQDGGCDCGCEQK